MKKGDILLTKQGLEDLKKELEELHDIKRPKLVERIKNAREQGDLSENSDYEAAREELSFVDGRIDELEEVLHNAKVVRASDKTKVSVNIGSTVNVYVNGVRHEYTVVGEWEANPAEKKISHTSPLGKALLGKKKGEEVEVEAPVGRVVYQIVGIS